MTDAVDPPRRVQVSVDTPHALHTLQALAAAAIDVVYGADADGLIQWISPSVTEVLGWTPQELVGRQAVFLVHPDEVAQFLDAKALVLSEGQPVAVGLVRVPCSSGQYRLLSARARPVIGSDGAVGGAVVVLADTSAYEAAVRALTTLSDCNRALARAVDEHGLLQAICDIIVATGGYAFAWYGRPVRDAAQSVQPVAAAAAAAGYLDEVAVSWGDNPQGHGPTGECMRTGMPQVRNLLEADPDYLPWHEAATRHGFHASIALPVIVHGELDGALMVYAGEPHAFDDDALSLMTVLAGDLSFGLERLRSLDEARRQRLRLQGAMQSQFDPFLLLEAVRDESGAIVDFRNVEASDAAIAFSGGSRDELAGRMLKEFFPDDGGDLSFATFIRTAETGEPIVVDDLAYLRPGDATPRRLDIRAVRNGDGLAVSFRDVTERFEASGKLARSEKRYRLLAENSSDVIIQIEPDGTISWTSESFSRLLGWRRSDVLGHVAMSLIAPDDVPRMLKIREEVIAGRSSHGEVRLLTADGNTRWTSVTLRPVPTAEGVARIAAIRDIDDEMRVRMQAEFAMAHDHLTGLPTLQLVARRVHERLNALRATEEIGVLCIGVDGLAKINEAFTFSAGDLTLIAVAGRISETLANPDLVGRGTGDEFIVIVPSPSSAADAGRLAETIRLAVKESLPAINGGISPTVSIGVATGRKGSDAMRLLGDASVALRQAKYAGRDRFAFVDDKVAAEAQARFSMEARIRSGLAENEFEPWWQPIVNLATEEVAGYEALVRWVHDGTVATPDQFLPIAEESDLIHDIDFTVLRMAIATLVGLPAPLFVSVNVSSRTLTHAPYAHVVDDLLTQARADAQRLHIEVTETALFNVHPSVAASMDRLAARGVRWYVDDFGTGYSSISHLRDLPISGLKLDLSFTRGIREHDGSSTQLAAGLASLANAMGMASVAEGVETRVEAEILLSQGWRYGQGWLYGQAAPLP